MRKLVVSMNLSLDGFLSGPRNGRLDWHFDCWSQEMGEKLLEHLDHADTILLGKNSYDAMAAYWPVKAADPHFPRQDLALAEKMNGYTKIVFTRSNDKPVWRNSIFSNANPETEITRLKNLDGKNIILYGSGSLASFIAGTRLVDEYLLWIHPVILGSGKLLFEKLNERIPLELNSSAVFKSGVAALSYKACYA
jgi:dihydrofolate reductase